MPKGRTRPRRRFISRLPPELRSAVWPPGRYHLLVLGERDYARDNRVWVAAGSVRHVGKLLGRTREWGIDLRTVAEGSIGLQELRWIQRSARAATIDGQWCRISDAIRLVLDAYAHSGWASDDDEASTEREKRIKRMDEAKQKMAKLAGA